MGMIFISYSSKNKTLTTGVKKQLEDAHYTCFLAHDDITVSADWYDEIWTALRACDAFVGLVTKEFNASTFCQQEVGAAFAMNKARLLVRSDVSDPPGFSGRFQGAKPDRLLHALNTLAIFKELRINSWIGAVGTVENYDQSNSVHKQFNQEWDGMSEAEKLRWLLAASRTSQVRGDLVDTKRVLREPIKSSYEPRQSAPFFRQAFAEMKPLLTNQWLFDNDKSGLLHDPERNPVGKTTPKPAVKKKSKRKA